MEQDSLFVFALEDLRHRCSLTASEYDMVRAAGLMRLLVLDRVGDRHARSLGLTPEANWLQVHRVHNLGDAQYEIATPYMDPVLSLELGLKRFLETEKDLLKSGSIERFLSRDVVAERSGGTTSRRASFADLIRHFANHEGGVHIGRQSKQTLLMDLREHLGDDLRLLLVIAGRIIYRALEPALIQTRLSHLIVNPTLSATADEAREGGVG